MSGAAYWIGMGDIHGHTASLTRIPELPGAAGVIISGDLTIKGGVAEAGRVIEAVAAVNPRILAQIGNMDHEPVQSWLDGKGMGIHARCVELAPGLALMGVGWSGPTPFHTPSEVPDSQLGEWLEQAWEQAKAFDHVILVSHTPPHGTTTDVVGPGAHVGSAAVRGFIERAQPDVCLTGHIHEARSTDTLGRTVVINPGDLSSGGYAIIGYDGSAVTARLMTIS
ncbi:metallophosphoesterase family protein [Fundidesulfovibrio terrae]|uniref:metallophosphoesterase family protein n=1 Tax=Fundidesulfovibrio terrae TaxID=2922866 RepID=UPI001FAF2FCE|nr:metallophosphoesterase [Fundidesulfovibrio terrae]